ncbi:MAG: SDR family NAD(P)-dependent oxidoreductase [Pseudomonadota bacterium]
MTKTILLTGATDGIGLAAAKILVEQGHLVLLHGRSEAKLKSVHQSLAKIGQVGSYLADLSRMRDVEQLAADIKAKHKQLDVLINNAGVFKTQTPVNEDGLDVRFVVNTLAPFLLTQRLLPLLGSASRVINLSSAAQAPVDLDAMAGKTGPLSDNAAYAQSKLAITMWSSALAQTLGDDGPAIVAVNPGSLLATNMVKTAYGIAGSDISIGANILVRAALSDEFATATGRYFDNDAKTFAAPHPDATNANKSFELMDVINSLVAE